MRRPADCARRTLGGRTSMDLARASLPPKSRSTTRRQASRILRSSSASDGASVRPLHPGFFCDLGPLADLALEAHGEFLRRAADRIGALARDPLADLRRLEQADGLAGDLVHDLLRGAGGGEHALPGADLVA